MYTYYIEAAREAAESARLAAEENLRTQLKEAQEKLRKLKKAHFVLGVLSAVGLYK